MSLLLRPIEARDDEVMAAIIRTVMPEFGADGPGFALHDPEVAAMFAAYQNPRHRYFVLERDGKVQGGAGIAPLAGDDATVCELRKMYFLADARGIGSGNMMMQTCLDFARHAGFSRCYLETLTGMDRAQRLYERTGFRQILEAMGATGHFACDRYFLLQW